MFNLCTGMASPLLGVAAVNSLLFGSFAISKRIVSPYPDLTGAQTALAGAMAGGITATLASPVEMFKIKSVNTLLLSVFQADIYRLGCKGNMAQRTIES